MDSQTANVSWVSQDQRTWGPASIATYKSALILLQVPLIDRLLCFPRSLALDILLVLRRQGLILLAQVFVTREQFLLESVMKRAIPQSH